MGKLKNNKKGFTLTEVLLVLITLAVIGVAGYVVAKHIDKPTAGVSTATSIKTSTTTKSNPASPTVLNVSAATQLVKNFYNQYNACESSGDLNQTCTNNLVTKDGTSSLYAYVNPSNGSYAENPVECAQDTPTVINVSGITSTSSSASGKVIETFGTSATTETVSFMVVSQSGSLKIDTVTCNPALSPSTTAP